MDVKLIQQIETPYLKAQLPNVEVGDTINVTSILRDGKGDKRRTQDFKGIVIAVKNSGARKTMTVRKVSHGVGVEKIFPMHSPNIDSIEILRKGRVRRSKIYYMRDRIGKKAMKIKDSGKSIVIEDIVQGDINDMPEDTTEINEVPANEVETEVMEVKEEEKTEEAKA